MWREKKKEEEEGERERENETDTNRKSQILDNYWWILDYIKQQLADIFPKI